jgi:hypothetical protein
MDGLPQMKNGHFSGVLCDNNISHICGDRMENVQTSHWKTYLSKNYNCLAKSSQQQSLLLSLLSTTVLPPRAATQPPAVSTLYSLPLYCSTLYSVIQ